MSLHPGRVVAAMLALLLLDLFIEVPTMTTILLAGFLPYAFIVAAGGAASAPDNLTPAILTCIGVSVALLSVWTVRVRRGSRV